MHPSLRYLRVRRNDYPRDWVILESRVEWLAGQLKLEVGKDLHVVGDPVTGSTFAGHRYAPLFDFFYQHDVWKQRAFRVINDPYVTEDTGTGTVHCAPAFGEEDHRVCIEHGIVDKEGELPCPVDESGKFTHPVDTYVGMYVKDADKRIKEDLKKLGRLILSADIVHSYPHCWRSDTPLIYRAVPSWFIRVESIRHRLLANNKRTRWVPAAVQEKRFHNWLLDARDWCVSRNRFWGTPLPLWASADYKQLVCLGSIAELQTYTKKPITDLHRHHIDDIEIPDPRGPEFPPLRRVDEVFDCWFESGSMPYAQQHYPFEHKETFEATFPADFVAEGLDQTRGWFYTLLVISTALFDKPPFHNLIVSGLVLAADGKKMSKRLKNYPDPMDVVKAHGADALRLFLVNSPVVRAESLRFREEGVKETVRDVILPWYHAYRFFVQEVTRFEDKPPGHTFTYDPSTTLRVSRNLMDRWILAAAQRLIQFTRDEMAAYRLYTVIPELIRFLDQLTNWYVRLNRERMRGHLGHEETTTSLSVLYNVLLTIVQLMAPYTPFIAEILYQNLKRALPVDQQKPSVHFMMMPDAQPLENGAAIEASVSAMQSIVVTGRILRERKKVSLKTPLKDMTIIVPSDAVRAGLEPLLVYIKEELNVMECTLSNDMSQIKLSATPNFKTLGARVGKAMPELSKAVKALSEAELMEFERTGRLTVLGHELSNDDLSIKRHCASTAHTDIAVENADGLVVLMNFMKDASLQQIALAREVSNRIQKLRKQLGLQQHDHVDVYLNAKTPSLQSALITYRDYIKSSYHAFSDKDRSPLETLSSSALLLHQETFDIGGETLELFLFRPIESTA